MNRNESKRLSRSERKRKRDKAIEDGRRRYSSGRGRGRRGGKRVVLARQHLIPMALLLKAIGAIAAIAAPVLLLLGPETGLVPLGAVSTIFVILVLIAVTGIGLGAVVDCVAAAVSELRELNAHMTRQWKVRHQEPGNDEVQNSSTDDATISS